MGRRRGRANPGDDGGDRPHGGPRRSEHRLRAAELWATTATMRLGSPYPYEELRRCWEILLLNQFHDILPGSSIAWVYRQADREFAEAADTLDDIIERSLWILTGDGRAR